MILNPFERLRVAAGLSQSVVADVLKIDRSTVSKWETGRSLPRGDKLPIMAQLFGCSINDFFPDEADDSQSVARRNAQ